MANSTKGLRRIGRNQYVVEFMGKAVGLITKKTKQYEAMRFGSHVCRSYHSSVKDAVGTLLAEQVAV